MSLTLWRPAAFGDFRKKNNASTHVALRRNISDVRVTNLVEASKDVASLLTCTRKKFFCLEDVFFFVRVFVIITFDPETLESRSKAQKTRT